jgi:hypothetical protein
MPAMIFHVRRSSAPATSPARRLGYGRRIDAAAASSLPCARPKQRQARLRLAAETVGRAVGVMRELELTRRRRTSPSR